MEIFKEQVCVVWYKGKCPVCGEKQVSRYESSVDVKCVKCRTAEVSRKHEKDLIGAVVVGVTPGSLDPDCCIDVLTLEKDGHIITMKCENGYEEPPEIVYTITD